MASKSLLKFIEENAPGVEPDDEKLHKVLIDDIKELKEKIMKAQKGSLS